MQNYSTFTSNALKAIQIAQSIAVEFHHANFSANHLLKALLHDDIGLKPLIESLDKNIFYLRDWADFGIENYPKSTQAVIEPTADSTAAKAIQEADMISIKLSRAEVQPVSLLLALLKPDIAFSTDKLKTFPLTFDEIMETLAGKEALTKALPDGALAEPSMKNHILKYCTDKTELARQNKLDPVIGRDAEIRLVFETLGRRLKSNAMILGEPGVGKTAIVDGIAQLIVEGKVPSHLQGAVLLELDIKSMIAGASYKGEFEERLKNVLKEIKELPNSILFIDEIHAFMQGGGSGGASVADMIKPELSRGQITVIGATTLEEYRKYIETDEALARRFDKIIIPEPDAEKALAMLKGIIAKYEDHHGLKVDEATLKEAIRSAKRYLKDNWLPDAAIDVLDRTMSAVRLANEQEGAVKRESVQPEDITATISRQTGIPTGRLQMGEQEKLLQIEENMKKRVVGQDHAIHLIAEAIRESRAGLSATGKPIGGFFLLGPTGTGKTETAKALAQFMFDDEQAMIRFDMSEFKEEHSAALLIGAPPGYIGYEEGGILVNKIREKPYSVVLFDEIEKAHQSVYDIFLQILDEGKLHDKLGKTGDFSNAVVLFTSNLGSAWLVEEFGKGKFPTSADLTTVMGQYFRPEFLPRLTDIIPFRPLTREMMDAIFDIHSASLFKLLGEKNISLKISKEARKKLIDEGFNPQFGARPLITVIRNQLRRPLAQMMLSGKLVTGGKTSLELDKDSNYTWNT